MKWILTLALVVSSTGLFAQNKTQIKKAEYYANQAAKEFSLDDDQKKAVYEARLVFFQKFAATSKQFKAKTISEEEKKEKSKQLITNVNAVLMELTGKKRKELNEFNKRIRQELKALK